MANILALDDNLELCKLIRTALERDGHLVETRSSGQELTEALCRWADCILLDVMMPGEDGFAVCRCIRGLTEAPILFLSARTDEAAVLKGLGAQNIGAGKHDRVDAILLVRVPGAYLASKFFPQTLLPMGLASACGSLFSILVCVIAYHWLRRQQKAVLYG